MGWSLQMLHIRRFPKTDRVPPAANSPRYELKSILNSLNDMDDADRNAGRRSLPGGPAAIGAALAAFGVTGFVLWMLLALPPR
jgi:hypothetical protein